MKSIQGEGGNWYREDPPKKDRGRDRDTGAREVEGQSLSDVLHVGFICRYSDTYSPRGLYIYAKALGNSKLERTDKSAKEPNISAILSDNIIITSISVMTPPSKLGQFLGFYMIVGCSASA